MHWYHFCDLYLKEQGKFKSLVKITNSFPPCLGKDDFNILLKHLQLQIYKASKFNSMLQGRKLINVSDIVLIMRLLNIESDELFKGVE